ncbi:hypothetical protein FRB97_007886 [Tulasnella sp. 331]|nr:hypothetical protein FRB97_007886 [Tulasnella sp. 331]
MASPSVSVECPLPPIPRMPMNNIRPTRTPPPPPSSASTFPGATDEPEDDIAAELARLESLRENLTQNLTLRPLRNASPPTSDRSSLSLDRTSPPPFSAAESTPRTSNPGSRKGSSNADVGREARSVSGGSPPSMLGRLSPTPSAASAMSRHTHHSSFDAISHYARMDSPTSPISPFTQATPEAISPSRLFQILSASLLPSPSSPSSPSKRPLILDTRPAADYVQSRLISSINLAIPNLILKRYRKYMTAGTPSFTSMQALRGFVTTEEGREEWDRMLGSPTETGDDATDAEARGGLWNGDVIIFDQDMDTLDPLAITSTASVDPISPSAAMTTSWLLLSVLGSLRESKPGLVPGSIWWLEGGFSAVQESASGSANSLYLITQDRSGDASIAVSSPSHTTPLEIKTSIGPRSQEPSINNRAPSPLHLVRSRSAGVEAGRGESSIGMDGSIENRMGSNTSMSKSLSAGGGISGLRSEEAVSGAQAPQPRRKPLTLQLDYKQQDMSSASVDRSISTEPSQSHPSSTSRISSFPSHSTATATASESSSRNLVDLNNTYSHDPSPPPSLAPPPRLPRLNLTDPPSMLSIASPISAVHVDENNEASGHKRQPNVATASSYGYPGLLDMSPSPSPSATTGYVPYPRTPTHTRSNTGAMLPRLGKLDIKSADRIATAVTPIDTKATSSSHHPPAISNINTKPLLNLSIRTNPSELIATNHIASQQQQQSQQQPPVTTMPPKLSLRTIPLKAATLAAPMSSPTASAFNLRLKLPASPNRMAFHGGGGGNVSGPSAMSPIMSPMSGKSVFFTPVQTPTDFENLYPFTPAESSHQSTIHQFLDVNAQSLSSPTTPLTARPPPSPSSSRMTTESEGIAPFTISTVLPGFLFLGPELTNPEQVEELQSRGVQRILNMAMECDSEDYGLDLKRSFDRYLKVPMRDNIEEDRVTKGLRDACSFIDDARLHSSPVYVHCKAGKSRSVTAVMAYLIHANHWPLARAYAFVMDRRKGVSPNIGFVSELMKFEEYELGGKSVGVVAESEMGGEDGSNGGVANARRGPAHMRDSMPPAFHHNHSHSVANGMMMGNGITGVPVSAGGMGSVGMGTGAGEEMEVKDDQGRYRHARRAPVNEQTLQPLRRVSKAGLESSWA